MKTHTVAVLMFLLALALFCFNACDSGKQQSNAMHTVDEQVFLVIDSTAYSTETGEEIEHVTYERDEFGNCVSSIDEYQSTDFASNTTELKKVTRTYSDFDSYGYYAIVDISEKGTVSVDRTIESGHSVKNVYSDGSYEEISYFDSGLIESVKSGSDEAPEPLLQRFDENGYINKAIFGDGDSGSYKYYWDLDANCHATSYSYKYYSANMNFDKTFTVDCDENGNIIRIYAENGQLYKAFQYVKVEKPSVAAWIEGSTKPH